MSKHEIEFYKHFNVREVKSSRTGNCKTCKLNWLTKYTNKPCYAVEGGCVVSILILDKWGVDKKNLKTKMVLGAERKKNKLLELVNSGKIKEMTLKEVAIRCGYNSPQAVRYVLHKLRGVKSAGK